MERAQTLLESGKPGKAAELYQAWLEVNRGDPEYADVLKKLIGIQDNAAGILDLLTVFPPGIEQAAERTAFTRLRISLLQMLGRIEEALQLSKTVPKTASAAYTGALLFYELGYLTEAEAELHLILRQPERVKAGVMARSNYLLARIQAAQGHAQEAEALYLLLLKRYDDSEIMAAALLGYIELLLKQEQAEEAAELLTTLQKRFPDSPEHYLARSLLGKNPAKTGDPRIAFHPSPDRLLPGLETRETQGLEMGIGQPDATQPQPTTEERVVERTGSFRDRDNFLGVQTGSFRDRDNAFYMIKDLESHGFEASILAVEIKEDTYFRVVAGWRRSADVGALRSAGQRSTQPAGQSPAAAQQLLIRLKEAGFEGVLLFLEQE